MIKKNNKVNENNAHLLCMTVLKHASLYLFHVFDTYPCFCWHLYRRSQEPGQSDAQRGPKGWVPPCASHLVQQCDIGHTSGQMSSCPFQCLLQSCFLRKKTNSVQEFHLKINFNKKFLVWPLGGDNRVTQVFFLTSTFKTTLNTFKFYPCFGNKYQKNT